MSSRFTYRDEHGNARIFHETLRRNVAELREKLCHYKDLEEQGSLIETHQAAVIIADLFGYEHPCNFNGIDEWFPEACDFADLCPDGKMSAIACWEQYIKIKLAEMESK